MNQDGSINSWGIYQHRQSSNYLQINNNQLTDGQVQPTRPFTFDGNIKEHCNVGNNN